MSKFSKDVKVMPVWPSFDRASAILVRLSGFHGYPHEEAGRELFIESLMQAVSPEHARAATSCFDEKFPTLRELRDAVSRTRTEFRRWNPNPQCVKCDGTGFKIVHRNFTDAAMKCDCWGDFEPREFPTGPFETADEDLKKSIQQAGEKMALKRYGKQSR